MRPVVDPRFAAELRRFRETAGLSLAQLAARASTAKAHLSDMENGRRNPSRQMADVLDSTLCAGGQLSALVHEQAALDGDELARIDYVTSAPRRVDAQAITSLRQILAGQRSLDDYVGAAAVLPAASATLRMVQEMVTSATGPVRDEALDLGAQWAQFLGWLHTTSGNWPAASGHFTRSLEWATERGDADMIATILSYEGYAHWLRGEYAPVASLSRAARRDPSVYPGQLAYDAFQEARGLAVTGQALEALSALAEADDLAAANEAWAERVPEWQYYRAPWFFALERGLVFRCLARHDRAYASRAVEELRAGVDGMPAEWQGAEWAAEYLTYLATAHRLAGDTAQARETLDRTRRVAIATNSARVLAMVDRVDQGL
jgi:transcriptional regulator with XRE-family HTH domain